MIKIYMAGCGGMLGEAFFNVFKAKGYDVKATDIDLNEDWLSFLDFRDYPSYYKDVKLFSPDYLFHIGAYTNLEYCEQNPEDTYSINTLSVENAVKISKARLNIPSNDDWKVLNQGGKQITLFEKEVNKFKDKWKKELGALAN